MMGHIRIARRWRLLLAVSVSLAILGACGAGAILTLTKYRSSYSQEQLEHVLAAIGSPPGFDQPGRLLGEGGCCGGVNRPYFGSGASETAMSWALTRFRALGLTNAQRYSPAEVTASCGSLGVSADYDPHRIDPPLIGPAVSIAVQPGSGRIDAAPDCPPQLIGP